MNQAHPKRLQFALSETTSDDGPAFEDFANQFLSTEFPNLQPVGGMHDGGKDGILYKSDSFPTSFIQSSVTNDFKVKIRRTIERLAATGSKCTELIYCSPHSIIKESEDISGELRAKGISLQIRDQGHFVAFCNNSQGRVAASDQYFQRVGAPILATKKLISNQEIQLSSEEERLALAFFGAISKSSDPEKSIVTKCYETIVIYCLRDSTNEKRVTKDQILTDSRKIAYSEHEAIFTQRVEGALGKLVTRGLVKNPDGLYHLANQERVRTEEQLLDSYERGKQALIEMKSFIRDLKSALKLAESIPAEVEARILLGVINSILCKQSEAATTALTQGQFSAVERSEIGPIVDQKLKEFGIEKPREEIEKIREFFIILTETMIDSPPPTMAEHFRRIGDAYFLFFLLRQPPRFQDTLNKIIGRAHIIVDASVLVPCLAEYAFGENQRSKQNVLLAALDSGVRLYVTDLGLTEIVTHTGKARVIYERIVRGESYYGQSALVTAYFSRKNVRFRSFEEMIEFVLGTTGESDLSELLRVEFGITTLSLPPYASLKPEVVDPLFASWKAIRQRHEGVDEADYDLLLNNDLRTYLFLKSERERQVSAEAMYGEIWWWLTEDLTAHSFDKSCTAARRPTICMQADYLLRYVSIIPRRREIDRRTELSALPISVDMAGLGIVADEIMAANREAAGIAEDEPLFMRQRKLREFINRSRSLSW